MIHLLRDKPTDEQINEMLEALETYIKLAVDVENEILAGGGSLHSDCEAILLESGSLQENVWGADWFPDTQRVTFESLINIRPRQGNRSLELLDEVLRKQVEKIVRGVFSNE